MGFGRWGGWELRAALSRLPSSVKRRQQARLVPDLSAAVASPVGVIRHGLAAGGDVGRSAERTRRLVSRDGNAMGRGRRIHGLTYSCQPHCRAGDVASVSLRATRPRATSICAIVAAPCRPSRRGTHPASSCCARSAATTTNSNGLASIGRMTMGSSGQCHGEEPAGLREAQNSCGYLSTEAPRGPQACPACWTAISV